MGIGVGKKVRSEHPLEDGRAPPLTLGKGKNLVPHSTTGWFVSMRLVLVEGASLPYRYSLGMGEKGALLRLI